MDENYNPKKIEETVQRYWEEHNCFTATEAVNKEKFYCLTMFPYPSGRLHMGHARNYTIGDVISRYQRMRGKNVLQPMGWDAFGLPAENAAIKNNIPPAQWTYQNIDFMRQQMKRLGLGYDWSREITTCDPKYYRWEQWFFLKLLDKGLVYKKNSAVNWDPIDQTVLANEQVINGRGWRSGALVERRDISQWFFKITDYAEELLQSIDTLEGWPDQVRTMQRHWIGKSVGVEVHFPVEGAEALTIFTTRPDTIYGVTYLAIAPEHPLAKKAAESNPEIAAFLTACKNIKVAEAEIATIEKKGLPLASYAAHPLTKKLIPIWVANFVLMDYGSGAVMAVPAHDQRDFEFAKKYHLPIKQVITPQNQSAWDFSKGAFTEAGELIESDQFTGFTSSTAIPQIIEVIENHGYGKKKIHYRLRDWGISRQRYWGTPIPIINCETCGPQPVPEADLPVVLPEEVEFSGIQSPLKSMPEFLKAICPKCQQLAQRETDTFDTFVESSWYYARFACKKQDSMILDGRANYWVPVDQYVGGVEHAVMHLLYARFFHKAMRDCGLLNSDEPFLRLLNQGHVLNQGIKMSKSKGNVVDSDDLIERYGADTVRLFMMFAAPPEQSLEWSESGVEGAYRFLKRLWAYAYDQRESFIKYNLNPPVNVFDCEMLSNQYREVLRQIYEILDLAKFDYERSQLNTIVSGCMKLLNILTKLPEDHKDAYNFITHKGMSILLRLLAPIAPHITHQLWHDLHFKGILMQTALPKVNTAALKIDHLELVVQVNGKLRTKIIVPSDASEKQIQDLASNDQKVHQTIAGKAIRKIIVVPGRLVNIVTG